MPQIHKLKFCDVIGTDVSSRLFQKEHCLTIVLNFALKISSTCFKQCIARDFSHECVDSPFSESLFANRIVIIQNFFNYLISFKTEFV